MTYLLVYADDILIIGNDQNTVHQIIQELRSKFALKDLGHVHLFLGIQVTTLPNGSFHLSHENISEIF